MFIVYYLLMPEPLDVGCVSTSHKELLSIQDLETQCFLLMGGISFDIT